MPLLSDFRALSPAQRNAFLAAYLGWTLDAFDYFLLVFVLRDVARDFHVTVKTVSEALFLTLAFRPVGALLFGMAADRYGRRVPLLVNVLLYSLLERLSGLSPGLLRGTFTGLAYQVGADCVPLRPLANRPGGDARRQLFLRTGPGDCGRAGGGCGCHCVFQRGARH